MYLVACIYHALRAGAPLIMPITPRGLSATARDLSQQCRGGSAAIRLVAACVSHVSGRQEAVPILRFKTESRMSRLSIPESILWVSSCLFFFNWIYIYRNQRRDQRIDELRVNIERGKNVDASKRVLRAILRDNAGYHFVQGERSEELQLISLISTLLYHLVNGPGCLLRRSKKNSSTGGNA